MAPAAGAADNKSIANAIHSDEEWSAFLEKPGLKVLDVYAKWAGPCEAMQSIFKRMKLDFADGLQFYQAQTDVIDALSKYRNKSCPTFMFFYNSTLVKIVKGANAPMIEKSVKEQLDIEKNGGIHHPLILDPNMALGGGYHGQTPSVAQASYTATTSTGGASGATATASASLNLSQSSSEEKAALTLEDSSRLEYTLAFIKPDAMHPSAMSEILNIIKRNRIEIVNKKKVWLSKEQAEQFYLEHRGTEWFERLTSFISSAPILVMKLAKENVVNLWRQLVGPTSTVRAKEEAKKSVRALFGTDNMMNAVFGSASLETSRHELEFFFPSDSSVPPPVLLTELKFHENALDSSSVSSQKTLLILLPDVCGDGGSDSKHVNAVIEKLLWSGFSIVKREEMVLERELVSEIYKSYPQREEIVEFATSAISLVLVLKGDDIVYKLNELVGPIDVKEAKDYFPMSFKALFGTDNVRSAAYCSSSIEDASRDIQLLFPRVSISRHGSQMLSRSESTNLKSVRGSLNNLTSRSHGSISRSLNNLSKEKKNELLERTLGIIHAEAYKAEEVDSEIEREKEVEQEVEVEVEVATEQFNAETGEKTTVMVKQIEKKMQLVKKKFTDIERVVKRWRKDEIFKKITDHDFKVVFEQEIKLSIDAAKELFKGSAGSAHFDDLVKSVTSGPVYAFVLEKDSAVNSWQELLGPNSPAVAKQTSPTSLRAMFGISDSDNSVYGSDQPLSAEKEILLVFGDQVNAFPDGKQPAEGPNPHLNKVKTSSIQNLVTSPKQVLAAQEKQQAAQAAYEASQAAAATAASTTAPSAATTETAADPEPTQPMPIEKTLALIKPDAYGAGKKDEIINRIKETGFEVIEEKELHLAADKAKEFYTEHDGKPFYNDLVSWMSSAPIYAMVLQKENGIKAWRELAGPTNSNKARESAPQSIRALYGKDGSENAVHGSDSPASAEREIKIIFSAAPTPAPAAEAASTPAAAEQPVAKKSGSKSDLAGKTSSSKPVSRAGSSNLLAKGSKQNLTEAAPSTTKSQTALNKTTSKASLLTKQQPGSKAGSQSKLA